MMLNEVKSLLPYIMIMVLIHYLDDGKAWKKLSLLCTVKYTTGSFHQPYMIYQMQQKKINLVYLKPRGITLRQIW